LEVFVSPLERVPKIVSVLYHALCVFPVIAPDEPVVISAVKSHLLDQIGALKREKSRIGMRSRLTQDRTTDAKSFYGFWLAVSC